MIDLCPVGALTSKPFRYTARTWELVAAQVGVRRTMALGSNLIVQVKNDRVMRVRAARERGDQRMLALGQGPLLLRGAQFRGPPDRADGQAGRRSGRKPTGRPRSSTSRADSSACATSTAPARRRARCRRIRRSRRWHCAQKLVRGLGSDNIDFRLRQSRFPRRRQRRRRAVARHADRRGRQARSRARRRQLPAQGPSAARAAAAPGGEEAARSSRCCTRPTTIC